MKPLLYLYTKEILYRFAYTLVSFIICTLISFWYIQSLLFLETYPFLKSSKKTFIVTQVTELIDVSWTLALVISFMLIFPLFIYQITKFIESSWYSYQIRLLRKLNIFSLVFYWMFLIFCYIYLLPTILIFLSQWEITRATDSVLNIKIQFRISDYVHWILRTRSCLGTFFYVFIVLSIQLTAFLHLSDISRSLQLYRKQMSFVTILLLFFASPPDVYLQFYIVFMILTLYEVIFLSICYKLQTSNAHHSTTTQ